jgi:hypothetical protein
MPGRIQACGGFATADASGCSCERCAQLRTCRHEPCAFTNPCQSSARRSQEDTAGLHMFCVLNTVSRPAKQGHNHEAGCQGIVVSVLYQPKNRVHRFVWQLRYTHRFRDIVTKPSRSAPTSNKRASGEVPATVQPVGSGISPGRCPAGWVSCGWPELGPCRRQPQ